MANSFLSFLKKVGQDVLKVITFGSVAAEVAAPVVSAFNPAIGALLTGSAQVILGAEVAGASAVAAAPGTDTSAQKAALAVQAITPMAQKFCQEMGLSAPTQQKVLDFNNAMVAALNIFGVAQQELGGQAPPAA